MAVSLDPVNFYGKNLPRPRYYPNPKFSSSRVDPPVDPLMEWAHEAHWSMGGLNFRRVRLQGRIEGNISKLRGSMSPRKSRFAKERLAALDESEDESEQEEEEEKEEEVVEKSEESEESDEEVVVISKKRKRARRLGDEFDKIAEPVPTKENKKASKKVNDKVKTQETKKVKKEVVVKRISLRRKK